MVYLFERNIRSVKKMIITLPVYLRVVHLSSCLALILISSVLIPIALQRRSSTRQYDSFLGNYATIYPDVTVMTSVALFGSALVGFWAASVGDVRAFRFYGICLASLILLKIMLAGIPMLVEGTVEDFVEKSIDRHMDNFALHPEPMNDLQYKFLCCGKRSSIDWYNVTGYLPASCCPDRTNAISSPKCIIPEELYSVSQMGCLAIFVKMLSYYKLTGIALVVILVTVELISLYVTFYISHLLGRYYEERTELRKLLVLQDHKDRRPIEEKPSLGVDAARSSSKQRAESEMKLNYVKHPSKV